MSNYNSYSNLTVEEIVDKMTGELFRKYGADCTKRIFDKFLFEDIFLFDIEDTMLISAFREKVTAGILYDMWFDNNYNVVR